MNAVQGDNPWERQDPDIEYEGKKIVLPDDPTPMGLRTAADTLLRKADDEETQLSVNEIIDAYPDDALVAFNMAMKEMYGWASPKPIMSFFGPIPPELRTVHTGPNPGDVVQVPIGRFTIPGIEESIFVEALWVPRPVLVIHGTVRKRERHFLVELVAKAREILSSRSIYKGKAIRMRVDGDGHMVTTESPTFLHTSQIRPEELVLNQIEHDQVSVALWAPIRNTEACRRYGIPLKRGVLLEGPFGTGKTLTAHVTSKHCVDNGWTYVLLDDVRALKEALLFAQRYQPAVVFAEDVDRIIAERDQHGNDLLNTIDGILSKDSQVITVLTTNFVEKLDQAMLRPGRLDAVITIAAPDQESVKRLIHIYGRGTVDKDADLNDVAEVLAGNIPATIREVVERSKLAMISRGESTISSEALLISARGMTRHLELLSQKPEEPSINERLGQAFTDAVSQAMTGGVIQPDKELNKQVMGLRNATVSLRNSIEQNTEVASEATQAITKQGKKTLDTLDGIKKATIEIHKAVV